MRFGVRNRCLSRLSRPFGPKRLDAEGGEREADAVVEEHHQEDEVPEEEGEAGGPGHIDASCEISSDSTIYTTFLIVYDLDTHYCCYISMVLRPCTPLARWYGACKPGIPRVMSCHVMSCHGCPDQWKQVLKAVPTNGNRPLPLPQLRNHELNIAFKASCRKLHV